MTVYIVLDGSRVVGVSARLQGAELIRANEARKLADRYCYAATANDALYKAAYDRLRIENHNVQDED